MTTRLELKQKEQEFLLKESQKSPELFNETTFIDNAEILNKFGIFIKNQENLAPGFLKLSPQDFIVEEVSQSKEIFTIDYENVFSKNSIVEDNPTIYATLVKCSMSTLEAVSELQEFLDCEQRQIQYSGIKDKNAIAAQRISFRNISEIRLAQIHSPFYFLKDVVAGKGVVNMGGIKGNKFTILTRTEQNFNQESFLKNLEKIKKEGFYNFYYLQRFGAPRLKNFLWAVLILKGQYREAVRSFLTDAGERETLYFKNLRQEIKKHFGNWKEIKKLIGNFPVILANEIKVIDYLENNPTDFKAALAQIPEQITLWIYALSSFLFNCKLTSFIKNNEEIPEKLPLFLNRKEKDWLYYKDLLEKFEIYPPLFRNLQFVTPVLLKERQEQTKIKAEIYKTEILQEGVILEFFLPKAVYATTFLAHLFNLASGALPDNLSVAQIDIKAVVAKKPMTETLNYFKDAMQLTDKNILEEK